MNLLNYNFEITTHVINHTGVIILDRPKSLNALSLGMIRSLKQIFDVWQVTPEVSHIIIKSNDLRAYCAGGDIRAVYEAIRANIPDLSDYFAEEYALNLQIATYPKPITALVDGYVMGGGVGISIHTQNRVATENAVWAMPETAIGFMPDVGASYFLNQMPHRIGYYLGMTSHRIGVEDGVFIGAHTHTITRERLAELFKKLCDSTNPSQVLLPYSATMIPCDLQRHATEIEHIFNVPTWRDVLNNLNCTAPSSLFATRVLEKLQTRCPMSVAVTFEMLKLTHGLSLAQCLQHEARIAHNMINRPDFCEGVRAVLIDKDNAPKWQPDNFADINDIDVQKIVYG